jgi:hypothetical protein
MRLGEAGLLSSNRTCLLSREGAVARLLIVVLVGAVLAVGATFLVSNLLSSAANGTPSNASLFEYGSR